MRRGGVERRAGRVRCCVVGVAAERRVRSGVAGGWTASCGKRDKPNPVFHSLTGGERILSVSVGNHPPRSNRKDRGELRSFPFDWGKVVSTVCVSERSGHGPGGRAGLHRVGGGRRDGCSNSSRGLLWIRFRTSETGRNRAGERVGPMQSRHAGRNRARLVAEPVNWRPMRKMETGRR